MTVEILQECGDYVVGQIYRMDERRALNLIRTGYAKAAIETAVMSARETAAQPPRLRKTQVTEKR